MANLSDLTFLKTFASGDASKITKYVNMFLNMAPQTLQQMRQQLEASDWKSLRTAAHSLKSQLKYMGANETVDIAYSIERSAADATGLDQLADQIARLEANTGQIMNELREELTKL